QPGCPQPSAGAGSVAFVRQILRPGRCAPGLRVGPWRVAARARGAARTLAGRWSDAVAGQCPAGRCRGPAQTAPAVERGWRPARGPADRTGPAADWRLRAVPDGMRCGGRTVARSPGACRYPHTAVHAARPALRPAWRGVGLGKAGAGPSALPGAERMTTLMVQGTTSDAGKSTLVTALCRWLARQGVAVAPFKPQNMALNSAVTADGGEIGRAQAVQAQAAGLPPHTDMNPVLLKPNSDTGAQVIIHGRAVTQMDAAAYHDYKRVAMQAVLESHRRLSERYQVVMVEGASSPAEINLRTNDIANMGFAEAVDCPVILIADIDKGGVFAHLVGTLELLSASEQARVRGFVINRFRGDIALLQPGLDWLERRTGKPVLGVLPYLMDFHLEAEDAVDVRQSAKAAEVLKVVVPVLPRISNHTDVDPLLLHPRVDLRLVVPGQPVPAADLIVLAGSKSVRADLAWLRANGWEEAIQRHLRYGGKLLGICGGLQMLGQRIADPLGLEGAAGESEGLGLLAFDTVL